MVRADQDLVFLSMFSTIFASVFDISLTVDQSALVCVSTHLHPDLRIHENHVLSWQPS